MQRPSTDSTDDVALPPRQLYRSCRETSHKALRVVAGCRRRCRSGSSPGCWVSRGTRSGGRPRTDHRGVSGHHDSEVSDETSAKNPWSVSHTRRHSECVGTRAVGQRETECRSDSSSLDERGGTAKSQNRTAPGDHRQREMGLDKQPLCTPSAGTNPTAAKAIAGKRRRTCPPAGHLARCRPPGRRQLAVAAAAIGEDFLY